MIGLGGVFAVNHLLSADHAGAPVARSVLADRYRCRSYVRWPSCLLSAGPPSQPRRSRHCSARRVTPHRYSNPECYFWKADQKAPVISNGYTLTRFPAEEAGAEQNKRNGPVWSILGQLYVYFGPVAHPAASAASTVNAPKLNRLRFRLADFVTTGRIPVGGIMDALDCVSRERTPSGLTRWCASEVGFRGRFLDRVDPPIEIRPGVQRI
jgi:hypothetical protein